MTYKKPNQLSNRRSRIVYENQPQRVALKALNSMNHPIYLLHSTELDAEFLLLNFPNIN